MATINSGLGGPTGHGENSFRPNTLTSGNYDDGSIQVNVTSVFENGINFFGTTYNSIYINSNGLITFAAPQTAYIPTNISSVNFPAIAPFWSDVNITTAVAGGNNNIYWDLDPAGNRVTITWLNVRPYTTSGVNANQTNTFQLVLEDVGDGNVRIEVIYQNIGWTNGYNVTGNDHAQAGITNGGALDYPFPGSGNRNALLNYPNADLMPNDGQNVTGVWSTRIHNGQVVCFVAGTLIATPGGPRPVETLAAGDLVTTLDAGPQPLLWSGGGEVIATGAALPVRFAAGSCGNARPLEVSGAHLVLVEGPDCELLFGEREVLVAAHHLLGQPGVTRAGGAAAVSYRHLLLAAHHILLAEGARVESLHPGPYALENLTPQGRASLLASMPEGWFSEAVVRPAARRILRGYEARALLAGRAGTDRGRSEDPRAAAAT